MDNRASLETLIAKHGFTDFKWMNPQDVAYRSVPESQLQQHRVAIK
jgi:hypothetical protein